MWGPACWRLVFTTCFKLPRQRCVDMFEALRFVLPCVHCRRSYRMYLQRLPPEVAIDAKPHAAAKFAWTVKDYVNGKLGTGVLPFSTLCARHEVFSAPVSRMDVVDLLCCVAMQVDDDDQVGAYETFAGVLGETVRACGETLPMHLPLDAKYRSPATLWLHAMKLKNALCTEVGAPTLTREQMMVRYRREAPAASSSSSSSSKPPQPMLPTSARSDSGRSSSRAGGGSSSSRTSGVSTRRGTTRR